MKRILWSSVTLGLLASAAPAMATPITFTNAAAFAAATVGYAMTTETFDAAPNALLPYTHGNLTAQNGGTGGGSTGAADGGSGQSVFVQTGFTGNARFEFASAITAFGINLFDLGTQGPTTLSYTLSNGATGNLFTSFEGLHNNVLFVGLIETTPFTSIQFNNSEDNDALEWDNAQYGAVNPAVPEPASLTLLGLGLAGAATRRFKNRKSK